MLFTFAQTYFLTVIILTLFMVVDGDEGDEEELPAI